MPVTRLLELQPLLLCAVLLCAAATLASAQCTDTVAMSWGGTILGICNDTQPQPYRAFLGIPFGETTAGANRFMPPVAATPWTGELNGQNFYWGCPQVHHNPDTPTNTSEDCLALNIWTPYNTQPSDLLPTTIYIHGGTFAEGGSMLPFYWGQHIVATSGATCFVTIAYRLHSLGFVVIGYQGDITVPGNMGLQDQRMAIQWVRDNAAAFGCDGNRITLQGESAGAMSVGIHMASPASAGLFTGAIMESNVAGYYYRDQEAATATGLDFAAILNCQWDDLPCLQAAPLASVIYATDQSSANPIAWIFTNPSKFLDGFIDWSPVITGPGTSEFPLQPLNAFASGAYSTDVNVIIGTNANESVAFLMGPGTEVNGAEYRVAIAGIFGVENAKAIFEVPDYAPPALLDSALEPFCRLLTAYWFQASSMQMASLIAVRSSVYVYWFDTMLSFDFWGKYLPQCADYVCHGDEIPFVFANLMGLGSFTPPQAALSAAMIGYWTNLGASGSPNSGPTPVPPHMLWPQWSVSEIDGVAIAFVNSTIGYIGTPPVNVELWNTIGYDW